MCDCVVFDLLMRGTASLVTSQGQLDANDVACNNLCVQVKLNSHSEEN